MFSKDNCSAKMFGKDKCSAKIKMFSKDVRLPVHLQRAMAAEAEAAREARAKVMIMIFSTA